MNNEGKFVRVSYVGTFDNGEVFDSTEAHGGTPLEFICMAGQMIPGFDRAVREMEVGEIKKVHIPCAEAYGERDENLIVNIPKGQVPNVDWLSVGQTLYLQDANGTPIPARIAEIAEDVIKFDLNNEMAGKDLNFEITLIEALDKKPEA